MPPHFHLEYYEPPQGLERHLLALFHFAWDAPVIHERHPGALAQLVLFPHGTGTVTFGQREDAILGEAYMISAFSTAVPYSMNGPWHAIGASLSPFGWAALTGRSVKDLLDRVHPAHELLGDDIRQAAHDINTAYRAGKLDGRQACKCLAQWIEARLQQLPPAHERLIERTIDWLGQSLKPDVEALFDRLDYSRRQAERLIEQYFGFPPAALARKYRAVRAASLLARANLSDRAESEIAEAFYDQPHMVREIRRYCGYTPAKLGGSDEPLFLTLLRMKNLSQLGRSRTNG